MTGFDIIVLLFVGIGAAMGFFRGFVQEVISLGAWVASVIAIRYFHADLSAVLGPSVGTESGGAVLAFAILLLAPYTLVRLVAKWAGSKSRESMLGPIDRVLGFGFGAVKGMILIVFGFSVLMLAYDTVWGESGRPEWISQARTYPLVNAASEELVTMISERREEGRQKSSATRSST